MKREFEIIEGKFHDGLGTYAELVLANNLIRLASLRQREFAPDVSEAKMRAAIAQLPDHDPRKVILQAEIRNIEKAARLAATLLLEKARPCEVIGVVHTAAAYQGACAGDLLIEFADRPSLPISVKTDKSGRVAVADGQTTDIAGKWALRYFRIDPSALDQMMRNLGYGSMADLKLHYLNVAELAAEVLKNALHISNLPGVGFSGCKINDLEAVKYLLRQLLHYKKGSDGSHVVVLQRRTGSVVWNSLIDSVDVETLTLDRISTNPSVPRAGYRVCSTFGLKVDGRTVVTFQVKHKRGKSYATHRRNQFGDITTRIDY